jgi:excisionase family DNA binding protein
MAKKLSTTKEVAARIGVSRQTLYNWIEAGLITAPDPVRYGGASVRFWTQADISRAAMAKGTLQIGRPVSKKRKKEGAR